MLLKGAASIAAYNLDGKFARQSLDVVARRCLEESPGPIERDAG